jgi:hypothetical protein
MRRICSAIEATEADDELMVTDVTKRPASQPLQPTSPLPPMSSGTDILVIYNDDADVWCRYVVDHLGKEQFRLRLQTVTDTEVLDWMTAAASATGDESPGRDGLAAAGAGAGGSGDRSLGAQRLTDASKSKTFIVVASPGHIRVLYENQQFDYGRLIDQPERAQVCASRRFLARSFDLPTLIVGRSNERRRQTKNSSSVGWGGIRRAR